MKIIRKYAEHIGYTIYHGERINEWRCPNKKCGLHVMEDYNCCPYCGQKIKFKEPLNNDVLVCMPVSEPYKPQLDLRGH